MSTTDQPHPNVLSASRVLIFGGTSGIGFATASAALSNNASVYISSSSPDKVRSAVARLQALYPTATIAGTAADLSQQSTVEHAVRTVLDAALAALGGPLDHIALTAGAPPSLRPLADLDVAAALDFWSVRYLAPLALAKHVAATPGRYLTPACTSSITLTSGVTALRPRKGIVGVIGSAGALQSLSRALAVEFAPIRVNLVLPGAVATPLLEPYPEAMKAAMVERSLTGRLGSVEGCAEAYLFCMRSTLATAQEVVVDNGALSMPMF